MEKEINIAREMIRKRAVKLQSLLKIVGSPRRITHHPSYFNSNEGNSLVKSVLNPRVKPWVIQSFLTFDSRDRTSKCY